MSGRQYIDFAKLRADVSMEYVLESIGFERTSRHGPQLRGPCPIHGSENPRSKIFSVNLAKKTFHCFSCHAKGNQLDLYAAAAKLPFYDAMRKLMNEHSLPAFPRGKHDT